MVTDQVLLWISFGQPVDCQLPLHNNGRWRQIGGQNVVMDLQTTPHERHSQTIAATTQQSPIATIHNNQSSDKVIDTHRERTRQKQLNIVFRWNEPEPEKEIYRFLHTHKHTLTPTHIKTHKLINYFTHTTIIRARNETTHFLRYKLKSDLYKVPPPKIRNIPIYKLARKRERERCDNKLKKKNTTAKAARENSSRRE